MMKGSFLTKREPKTSALTSSNFNDFLNPFSFFNFLILFFEMEWKRPCGLIKLCYVFLGRWIWETCITFRRRGRGKQRKERRVHALLAFENGYELVLVKIHFHFECLTRHWDLSFLLLGDLFCFWLCYVVWLCHFSTTLFAWATRFYACCAWILSSNFRLMRNKRSQKWHYLLGRQGFLPCSLTLPVVA